MEHSDPEVPTSWISEQVLISEYQPPSWQRDRIVSESLDSYQLETDEVKWIGKERYMSPRVADAIKEHVRQVLSE